MSDPKNDITTSIEATEADVSDLKKTHYKAAGTEFGKATRMAPPVADQPGGLSPVLLDMLKLGKTYANFQGIDRCIKVIDASTKNAHHCGAMVISNLSTNQKLCSNCDRIRDPNAKPKVINSSMIRLTQKELEECGLTEDPLVNAKSDPVPKANKMKKAAKVVKEGPRRAKVKTPNKVTIDVTLAELKDNPNPVKVLLKRTLDAIFELPVSNFREAEEIRVVKERVEDFLERQKHNDERGAN